MELIYVGIIVALVILACHNSHQIGTYAVSKARQLDATYYRWLASFDSVPLMFSANGELYWSYDPCERQPVALPLIPTGQPCGSVSIPNPFPVAKLVADEGIAFEPTVQYVPSTIYPVSSLFVSEPNSGRVLDILARKAELRTIKAAATATIQAAKESALNAVATACEKLSAPVQATVEAPSLASESTQEAEPTMTLPMSSDSLPSPLQSQQTVWTVADLVKGNTEQQLRSLCSARSIIARGKLNKTQIATLLVKWQDEENRKAMAS